MSYQNQTLYDKLNIQDAFRSSENDTYLRKSKLIRYIILLATLIISTVFFTYHLDTELYKGLGKNVTEGQLWNNKSLVAERTFPLKKKVAQYNSEVNSAQSSVMQNFKVNPNVFDNIKSDISNILDTSYIYKNFSIDESVKKEYSKNFKRIRNNVNNILKSIYEKGIIDKEKSDILTNSIIVVNNKNEQTVLNLDNLFDLEVAENTISSVLDDNINQSILNEIEQQIVNVIQPNLIFSSNLTNQRRKLAASNVATNEEIIKKGTTLVEKNDRLTEKQVRLLNSYFSSLEANDNKANIYFILLSSFGHAGLVLSLLVFYLYNIRKRIFSDNFQLIILCILFVITALLTWLSLEISIGFRLEYLIFIPAFSMMVAIIFDSRTAFYFTVVLALLVAGVRGNDYQTAFIHLFAGAVASYTVRDIQNRTQMFKSIFFIFIGYIIPILIFYLERSSNIQDLLNNSIIVSANSILSPLITYGSIFILERFSNFSTDLQLKEYDNLDHELLQKMSDIAPGTYQHSLNVAMLAERAAIAIGANPVYCRVSSLFHDIGKMKKPEYFVENQIDISNKHDRLSPKKSAKIIIDHVNYGVELATKYKLPNRMIDVIRMHHGTTLVQYFYNKALEKASDNDEVNIDDFRYPGPKPKSREAALIMVCDTAEAISHIKNFTSDELDEILQKIIMDRISDGQFDESGISVKELQIIKFNIVKNLIGMGHKRIQYKEPPKAINSDYGISEK
ncbi:MAG: HD family phosphohydrolase [Chlorobiota bacterium]